MKKTLLTLLLTMIFISCKEHKKTKVQQASQTKQSSFTVSDALLEKAVIYEANIRQYSEKGDFNSFTKDIPELKKMGVKIIWLMPIYPISQFKRKATGDTFVSEIKNPAERKKYLGSPYAVSDYTAVNPDFGTKNDLDLLIETAHRNGIAVILDWVPNHTGWDHKWITEHPEYYTKNKEGKITDPLNTDGTSKGWQDVADLNYDNPELRKAMIKEMKYWIKNHDIDGFRCDVAGEVPLAFWQQAIPELRKEKPLFMLAEAWEPELLKDNLFDACYGWEEHFLMVDIAKGKKNAVDFQNYIKKTDTMYEADDIIMNFVANHDENSWKGTVEESFGDAAEVMTVLTYNIPGMPLIYNGQEYGLNHRLKFFEKDLIPKKKGKYFDLYQKLGNLKNNEIALNGGKQKAGYVPIETNNKNVLAFIREKNGEKIVFIANLSDKKQKFDLDIKDEKLKGIDLLNPENMLMFVPENNEIAPWAYYILKQK